MTVRMNLWSLTLLPGEPVPLYVRRDFQITNAALGEELRSKDGRSVVKVTHNPIPPSAFESDDEDDYDFEGDSDEESDDEEMEEDSEDSDNKEGSEENEDGSDSEDDEDDSDDEDMIEETSVLCSLTAGKIEQASLNLTFVEGEVVIFEVTGDNAVHLMGNYINQWPEEESDSECDSDHDDYSDLELDDEDEFSVEEFEEAPKGKITPIEEAPKKEKKAEKKVEKAEKPVEKKRKAEEIEEEKPTEQLSKAQKKKLAKKAKLEAEATAPAAAAPKKEEKKESNKKTLPNGLVIEDVKLGDGPGAKPGRRLGMRYIGKLTNGKQFDANTGGKPFSFVLGRGEVISGWDQGLVGMQVGGERRLTIPPKLAYGNQKIPGIPPNSTLKFDVKLVSIN